MKKIFTLIIGIVLSIAILNSQVAPPQAFRLTATITGASGQTVVDKMISLRVSILQDDMNGYAIFSESFSPTTDHYSQVAVEIGKGKVISGIFSAIDWSAHRYFLKIEVDAKGGTNYQLLSSTQLLSVPYALYSGNAGNAFSGRYNDLIGAPVLALVATTGQYNDLFGKPALFSGSYNDLTNKPTFFSGIYNDLTNKPTLFDGTWNSLTGKPAFSAIALSGSWKDLTNMPTTLTGYGITDAMNTSHPANGISATNITNWNIAFSWGNHAGLYKPISYVPSWIEITGKPTGNNKGDMQYWNGTNWEMVNVGSDGQVLTLINDIPTWRTVSSLCMDPIITTTDVTSITPVTALSGGNITSDGGCPVTARGLCYGTSLNPTIAGPKTIEGQGTGTFTSTMIGLSPGTQYHVRAFATINNSTTYGNDMTFTTNADPNVNWQPGNNWIDPQTGYGYKTVQIGSQVWMAEDLRTTKYANGDLIGTTDFDVSVQYESTPNYQWAYPGDESYFASYGRYYTWYAATDNRNVCPTSWHISTAGEWITLIAYLGGESVAGGKLKEQGTAHWYSPNTGATNDVGFTALPRGFRNLNGDIFRIGYQGAWWTSPETSSTTALVRGMEYSVASIGGTESSKAFGCSVRCVKN
jgi:uncharacterized protein (TIGR02145 family)